jgi:hypothetical protein
MHPLIQTWGSILRLYGSRMDVSFGKSGENDSKASGDCGEGKSTSADGQATCPMTAGASATAQQKTATATAAASQKAKPNKELLEKLKEEMRKLRKIQTAKSGLPVGDDQQQQKQQQQPQADINGQANDTLLTIPPLILNNCDFKLSSNDYLVTKESKQLFESSGETTDKSKQNDLLESEGIIMFSEKCTKTTVATTTTQAMGNDEEKAKRKRSLSNDDDDDDDSDSTSGDSSDSGSSSDEDGEDDEEEEEDEDGEINDDDDDDDDENDQVNGRHRRKVTSNNSRSNSNSFSE